MRHKIYFRLEAGKAAARYKRLIKKAVKAALLAEKVDVPCEVNVTFTDDGGIQALNREFRNVDKPTDVLSFPMQELIPGGFNAADGELDPGTGRLCLGDVVISTERAAAQAEEFGHSPEREAAYLTVHSVLHLLGYDHEDEGPEKRKMRGREKEIMAGLGITRDGGRRGGRL